MVKLFCKTTEFISIHNYRSVKKCYLFGKRYPDKGELKKQKGG